MDEERKLLSKIISNTRDAKRFVTIGVIVFANIHGEFNVHFYDDVDQPLSEISYFSEGPTELLPVHTMVERTVHATAMIPAERMPDIIKSLQEKYDQYLDYKENGR